jgi:hypothetical protein
MSKGIESLSGEVTMGTKIKCLIPVVNILSAEKNYYGGIKFCGISTILFIVSTVVKFVTWFFLNSIGPLNFITSIIWLLSILLVYIGNAVFVYTVIHDADGLSTFKLIAATIIYPIGQFYIGQYLATVIKNAQREENTFKI